MMRNLLRHHAEKFVKPVPPALEQPDLLEAEHLQPLAAGHSGLPEATDSLAYDPVQHLLTVQIALDNYYFLLVFDSAQLLMVASSSLHKHLVIGCRAYTMLTQTATCLML